MKPFPGIWQSTQFYAERVFFFHYFLATWRQIEPKCSLICYFMHGGTVTKVCLYYTSVLKHTVNGWNTSNILSNLTSVTIYIVPWKNTKVTTQGVILWISQKIAISILNSVSQCGIKHSITMYGISTLLILNPLSTDSTICLSTDTELNYFCLH